MVRDCILGVVRVSTAQQSTTAQRREVDRFCEALRANAEETLGQEGIEVDSIQVRGSAYRTNTVEERLRPYFPAKPRATGSQGGRNGVAVRAIVVSDWHRLARNEAHFSQMARLWFRPLGTQLVLSGSRDAIRQRHRELRALFPRLVPDEPVFHWDPLNDRDGRTFRDICAIIKAAHIESRMRAPGAVRYDAPH